jgi:hypothetical protein
MGSMTTTRLCVVLMMQDGNPVCGLCLSAAEYVRAVKNCEATPVEVAKT